LHEIGTTLGAYFWGQILVALVLSALYALGFAALRLHFWYVLAPVCGFLNFIPRVGSIFAMVLTLLLAALTGFGVIQLIELSGVFVVVFAIEAFVLTPRVLGGHVHLRPLYVFLAVLIGGVMFGFFGLLLAVPALAVAAVVYRFLISRGAA
jgi:predicted PurR-regulated permease PerM